MSEQNTKAPANEPTDTLPAAQQQDDLQEVIEELVHAVLRDHTIEVLARLQENIFNRLTAVKQNGEDVLLLASVLRIIADISREQVLAAVFDDIYADSKRDFLDSSFSISSVSKALDKKTVLDWVRDDVLKLNAAVALKGASPLGV